MKTDGMLLLVRGMRAGCAQRTAERRDIARLDAIVLSPIEHSIDVIVRVGSAVDEAKVGRSAISCGNKAQHRPRAAFFCLSDPEQ